MTSVRFDTSLGRSPGRSKSPSVKKSSKLVDSLNLLERRAHDLSKAITGTIEEAAQKSPCKEHVDLSQVNSEVNRSLIKRCESYCRYVASQPNKSGKQQKEVIDSTKAKLNKALEELQGFKENESVRLERSLKETQDEFTRKVKELERMALKRIDALKVELIEEMRRKEKDSEDCIMAKGEELAATIAPVSKSSLMERAASKSPGRSMMSVAFDTEESPVKRPSASQASQSRLYTPERLAPVFGYSFKSYSEKKANAKLTLQRLEESREKVMRLGRISLPNSEDLKKSYSTPNRRSISSSKASPSP